jgi:hypothetical protein
LSSDYYSDDDEIKSVLALVILYLNSGVIGLLEQAPHDAFTGIPWLPCCFLEEYEVILFIRSKDAGSCKRYVSF